MIKFPIRIEVESVSASGMGVSWTSKTRNLAEIPCAIPVEFMGPGDGYSPEDLFGLAVMNCLIATYKVYCEKSKITFSEISGKAIVTADKNPDAQGFIISQIEISVKVSGASNRDLAKQMLDTAIRDCAIGNSIKSKKIFHTQIL